MKTISIFLALINSLAAGLLLAFTLSITEIRQIEIFWFLAKIFAALFVISIGFITWLDNIHPVSGGILPLASLFLVMLGTGTLVWTFHRQVLTGDMESYMAIFGGSLLAQGISSLLGLAEDSRSMAAS